MPQTNTPPHKHRLDSQRIELLGHSFLIDQLIRGGIEVAQPLRDRGVDLVIYADLTSEVGKFISKPLQLKIASKRVFSLSRKYEKIADLIIAFVWHIDSEEEARVYAMTYADAYLIAEQLGWTKTQSWAKGNYSNTRPGRKIEKLLEPFQMNSESWFGRLTSGS
ncbi:MAG: hypothetical protein AAF662_04310 [Pseudomonadota bacterium]